MALDFHLGKTENEAEESDRALFIEKNLHELIFSPDHNWLRDFPQFHRFNDYYEYTVEYNKNNLKEMINELNQIQNKIDSSDFKEFVAQLSKVCHRALKEDKNIYCFSD